MFSGDNRADNLLSIESGWYAKMCNEFPQKAFNYYTSQKVLEQTV